MAVKIRLMRMGKKHQPTYRVVVADSRSPRDGRFIEIIGRYDPRHEPSLVEIDNEKAVGWLTKGAQPSAAVAKLLKISGAAEIFEQARPKRAPKEWKRAAGAKKAAGPAGKAKKAAGAKPAKSSEAGKTAKDDKAEQQASEPESENRDSG